MNIWNWITANWQTIVAAVGGVVLTSRIIVKLTPSDIDNVWLEKIVSFLRAVGLKID
jgi:hypothetical protein